MSKIFQKKGKIFENLRKNVASYMQNLKIFLKGQPHVCDYRMHETLTRICPVMYQDLYNIIVASKYKKQLLLRVNKQTKKIYEILHNPNNCASSYIDGVHFV